MKGTKHRFGSRFVVMFSVILASWLGVGHVAPAARLSARDRMVFAEGTAIRMPRVSREARPRSTLHPTWHSGRRKRN